MKRGFLIPGFALILSANALADEIDEFQLDELDTPFAMEEDIPVVLTASRLKQPKAEVPASVTVIEAEQIRAWGVKTLPELMRFVPGMFIGHGDDENNASVAYHASNPNLMRRLQVLLDGRSVFKAGIASVVWSDIPVAMEDILRIEVTRGPNAASYGANSFLGVINIVTKHPGDTLGTHVRYRTGTQGENDTYLSHSGQSGLNSYRLTFNQQSDDGFDGVNAKSGEDRWRDSRRHEFLAGYFSRQVDASTQLNLQAALKRGHTDIRQQDYQLTPPDQDNRMTHLWGKLQHEFSSSHQSHLQAYWIRDDRTQESTVCAPTVTFDPDLYTLYGSNPDAVDYLLTGFDASNPAASMAELAARTTPEEFTLATSVLGRVGASAGNLSEITCGDTDSNIVEQRYDVEWQDTVTWTDSLRTVSGASFRRDQADSQAFFGGKNFNDTWRLFFNGEWRINSRLITNIGAMYEHEDANEDAVSPRVALNWLLTPQQSIRLVYSEAVRSPDMLEQEPDHSITISNASSNYLGLSDATYFLHQQEDNRGLKHERISSSEVGYYGLFPDLNLELDVKLYQDHMSQLISNPINLQTTKVTSDSRMNINGAEMQLQWRPRPDDWLWLTAAYIDPDIKLGDTEGLSATAIDQLYSVETKLSAENSIVVSWHHKGESWSVTSSHIWYDGYNQGSNIYRRFELNGRKEWQFATTRLWLGGYWQHLISNDALNYKNQRYSENNLYYLQAGLDF